MVSTHHSSKFPADRKGSNENGLHSLIHIKGSKALSISLSMLSQNSTGNHMYSHLMLHNVSYIDFLCIHTLGGSNK